MILWIRLLVLNKIQNTITKIINPTKDLIITFCLKLLSLFSNDAAFITKFSLIALPLIWLFDQFC